MCFPTSFGVKLTSDELSDTLGHPIPDSSSYDTSRTNVDGVLSSKFGAEEVTDKRTDNRRKEKTGGDDSQKGPIGITKVITPCWDCL